MKLLRSAPIRPVDPTVTDSVEIERLSQQSQLVLDRMKRGLVSNAELAAISKKYSSRIADLRDAGYLIECIRQDHVTGEAWYQLMSPTPRLHVYYVACSVRIHGQPQPYTVTFRMRAPNKEMAERRAKFRAASIDVLKIVDESELKHIRQRIAAK